MNLDIPNETELVTLVFELVCPQTSTLFPQYTIGLHAWFLDQVRQTNPQLSQQLHDEQAEKPFTISSLEGKITPLSKKLQLHGQETYYWYISALSPQLVEWLSQWLQALPSTVALHHAPLQIKSVDYALPPKTYQKLWKSRDTKSLSLSFVSPTSFRRKKHHFPIPLPFQVFQSYLRRWNLFSGKPFNQDDFLRWVDNHVLIMRHNLESVKVAAGKRGSVTGFTGAVEYGLTKEASAQPEYVQLYKTLAQLAPYCGTGHKTTFGLGQTRNGWLMEDTAVETLVVEYQLAQRIEQISSQLMKHQKRIGGTRAINVCHTRATILAKQELGQSLKEIATELEMPYETVKTYAKLAKRMMRAELT